VTVKPSVPQVLPPPIRLKKSMAYWCGLLGSAGWLVGWPMLYAVVEPAVPKIAAAVWAFSPMAFAILLMLLADYSPTTRRLFELFYSALQMLAWCAPPGF
jgi:hypothetical protein